MPSPAPPAARWVGSSHEAVFGIVPPERLRRQLERAGIRDHGPWNGAARPGPTMLLLGDHVYDDALLPALAKREAPLALTNAGRPVAILTEAGQAAPAAAALAERRIPPGVPRLESAALVAAHRAGLRKSEPPFVMGVTARNRRQVEKRLFASAYKGITDVVTKYVWPLPARLLTRWCAARGVSPNAVTLASLALAVAALVLLREGWLAWGLAAAWAMTFLDTVDGKLARVTVTSSKLGGALDHGLDLVHPPFWYWAWHVGSGAQDTLSLVVVIGGYLLLRAEEGLFLWRFGIEIHAWRPFDAAFRLVTSRRNPNLILLSVTLALGWPEHGSKLVAAWTLASLATHTVRLAQAGRSAHRGERPVSWLAG